MFAAFCRRSRYVKAETIGKKKKIFHDPSVSAGNDDDAASVCDGAAGSDDIYLSPWDYLRQPGEDLHHHCHRKITGTVLFFAPAGERWGEMGKCPERSGSSLAVGFALVWRWPCLAAGVNFPLQNRLCSAIMRAEERRFVLWLTYVIFR